MNRLHQHHERPKRQRGNAGQHRFRHHAERAELQTDNGSKQAGGHDAPFCRRISGKRFIQKRIREKTGEDAEIEHVAAEREQASVGEKEGLNRQHRRDGEKRGLRAEQNRQHHAAAEMPA